MNSQAALRSAWAILPLLFFSYVCWNKAKHLEPTYVLADVPLKFETGFSIRKEFRAESTAQVCLTIQRLAAPQPADILGTFDPDGIVAEFQIIADGATILRGQYPPYVGDWRRDGYDYRSFGSFRALSGQQYEVWFRIVEGSSRSGDIRPRLKVGLDPSEFGRGTTLALLSYGALFAAGASCLPLFVWLLKGEKNS